MVINIIILLITMSGCLTIKYWTAEDHQEMLMTCKTACANKMRTYTPATGVCVCQKKR